MDDNINNNEVSKELAQDKKWKKSMPHPYIVIFGLIALVTAMTWIIPSGSFDRVYNEAVGRTLVVPGTYHLVEHTPVGNPRKHNSK